MKSVPVLYDYWRSSASFRVRIALKLLGIQYQHQPINLLTAGQRSPDYLAINPQGLVPSLVVEGRVLTQSLAIIEYLHATTEGSTLLPEDPFDQHRVRQMSYAIAMEIHPVCNLRIVEHVESIATRPDARRDWMRHFIGSGLADLEALLEQNPPEGFLAGDTPTMADCCLAPQLYNADRWGVDYANHRNVSRIARKVQALPAVILAQPSS